MIITGSSARIDAERSCPQPRFGGLQSLPFPTDAGCMSEHPFQVACVTCGAVIPTDDAVFLPPEDLHAVPLVLYRACGDLDLEVDP